MSSVPAARFERPAVLRPRPLRVVDGSLDLYPGFLASLRIALAARRGPIQPPTRAEIELGRESGARV